MRTTAAVALVLAALSTLAACGREETAEASPAAEQMRIGPENIVVVQNESIATGPAISGELRAEREATLRAELAGAVRATFVDAGSRVGAGTVLAQIDDVAAQDNFLSARSAVTAAQSAADLAKREHERQQRLFDAGAIAERDLEVARRADIAAASQLADAKARMTLARTQLDHTKVRAPFAGVIAQRMVSAGDYMQTGGEMFRIVDPRSMRFEASVPATDLSEVQVGATVTFSVNGYPGRSFQGKVSRINPAADPTTGQVRIVVSIPNEKSALVGGLFAEGRVATERRDGISAPVAAVDLRGIRPFVMRLKAGKVEKVVVEVGLRDDERETVELASGVAAGDTLLLGAARGITAGTAVRVSVPTDQPAEPR
ncbi:MAG TPA: efflux RND transporter periplasmic adaptor subunit [Gemmatimonadaceae bacterium]|nr:efflux RND transporter periplasmic adaptor subunit [Gemmatimonadaceae bacterium]